MSATILEGARSNLEVGRLRTGRGFLGGESVRHDYLEHIFSRRQVGAQRQSMLCLQVTDIVLACRVERNRNVGVHLLPLSKQPHLEIQFRQILLVGSRVEDLIRV